MSKDRPKNTHLCGRTRRTHFNRAGIRFEQKWRAIELATLTKEQLDAIRGEAEIESRLCTAEEAEELCSDVAPENGPITKRSYSAAVEENAQLKRENSELRRAVDALTEQLRLVKLGNTGSLALARAEAMTGAPPTQQQQASANTAPLPLPPVPAK